MDTHKKIEELVLKKIELLNNKKHQSEDSKKELEKFNVLYRLIVNQYEKFFEKINMEVAISILKDIGIPEDELLTTYKELMKEEIKQKYILLDLNNNDKGER